MFVRHSEPEHQLLAQAYKLAIERKHLTAAPTVRLRAENSKNGEARRVTLTGELVELIERRKKPRQVKTKTGAFLADLVFIQGRTDRVPQGRGYSYKTGRRLLKAVP